MSLGYNEQSKMPCHRLIQPSQTYSLTTGGIVHCEDFALSKCVIPVRGNLAVEVKSDQMLMQRGKAEVEVFPGKIRHLSNVSMEAGTRLVNKKVQKE